MAENSPANPFAMRTDRQLVRRMLNGEEAAFDSFFEDHFDGLYRFALTRLDFDETLASEVVQAAMTTAIEKLDTYRAEAALFSWLCTICRYEISAHFRRLKRAPEVELEEDSPGFRAALETLPICPANPETETHRKEVTRLVHMTLDHLPARYGQALEWKYLDGLSVREIADRLEVGPKAAESILTRARDAFRRGFSGLSSEMAGAGFQGLRTQTEGVAP